MNIIILECLVLKKYLKLVKLIKKNEKLGEFLITDLLKIAFKKILEVN